MQDLAYLRGWLKEVESGLESGYYDVSENIFSEVEVQRLNNKAIGERSFMSLIELVGKQNNCK